MDLSSHVSHKESFSLNASSSKPLTNLFFDNAEVCRSDCDSQLLLTIVFTESVKLSAVAFLPVEGESPNVFKLWINKKELSFEDVPSTKVNFELTEGDLLKMHTGDAMQLPSVKFPACNSVTVFLDAEGKDTVVSFFPSVHIMGRAFFYDFAAAGVLSVRLFFNTPIRPHHHTSPRRPSQGWCSLGTPRKPWTSLK